MQLNFLVVDDDRESRQFLRDLLELLHAGADVRLAASNEEAFRCLKDFTPHLITTDISRPGGDGYEFLTALREDPKTEFTSVIAISGQSWNEREELRQYRHGFNAVLRKPFEIDQLLRSVDRALSLRTNPDALLIHLGVERQDLDYKGVLDLKLKEQRAALAKDVIAMANWGGGTIIIGVEERSPGEFVSVGVDEENLASFETTRVNLALRQFMDPPVSIVSRHVRDASRIFVLLEIPPARDTFVLAGKQNEQARLFPGRIYSRTHASESCEVQSSSELRDLFQRLRIRSS